MSQNQGLNADPIHQFLIECHNITSQATFIIDSLPNAESAAIEGVVHQLYAIRTILHSLNDDQMDEDDVNRSVTYIDAVLKPLQDFLDNPPPPPSTTLPQIRTGKRGRPRYALDLQRVILLHDLAIHGTRWLKLSVSVNRHCIITWILRVCLLQDESIHRSQTMIWIILWGRYLSRIHFLALLLSWDY